MTKRYTKEWRKKISLSGKKSWKKRVISEATRKKLSEAGKKGNMIRNYKKLPFAELKSWTVKRNRLFEERGRKCEQCGWAKKRKDGIIPVEVDAKDGDHTNPNEDNFKILCPNCHSLTDNYMFYGRKHR